MYETNNTTNFVTLYKSLRFKDILNTEIVIK